MCSNAGKVWIRNAVTHINLSGMLKFNMKRVFQARGIERPYSFLVRAGFSPNHATRVVNGRVKQLNLDDIERLCVLLKCMPNDLLEWTPGKNFIPGQEHPLSSLQRVGQDNPVSRIWYSVPIDRLQEIETLVRKELEKQPPTLVVQAASQSSSPDQPIA